jgi:hypothetical protein
MHTKIWKYEDHPITLYYKALFMQETQPPLQTLQDIRRMMERSSRFISLSGWSGICAGICALAGAIAAYLRLKLYSTQNVRSESINDEFRDGVVSTSLINDLLWIAGIVFVAAFLSAFFFTYQRSKKNNTPIWDPVSRRLIWNTVIPMLVGGACILRLLQVGEFDLVAPMSLIFYGLALLNASKYTLGEIRYLAFGQLILGIINLWLTQYSLLFWALGFGVLHIIYGALMWWKYER